MKENWKTIPFEKSIEKVKYTTKIPSSDYKRDGKYPVVSQEEGLISGYWNNDEDVFHIQHPIVVFGDHTRILKYIDFDFVLGADGVKILSPVEGLNAKFFCHYLQWYKIPSLGYSRHFKLLKEISVPIPPLPEQESIVKELDLLSGIIEKKKQQLKELDNLAQSIFYEMFGDNDGKEIALNDAISIANGLVSPTEKPYCDMPHIGPANIMSGTGEIYDVKTAKEEALQSGKYYFTSEMVLYSKIRPALNKVAVYGKDGICSADMYPLHPKSGFDKMFILHLLRQKPFLEYAISCSGRANIPKINREALLAYRFSAPAYTLQQSFAQKIEAIESQKELINQSIKETETLFNSRMDYYFN